MNHTLQMLAFNLRRNCEAREIKRLEINEIYHELIGDIFCSRYTLEEKKRKSRNMYILAAYLVTRSITVAETRKLNKAQLIELHKKARAQMKLTEILSFSELLECYKRRLERLRKREQKYN